MVAAERPAEDTCIFSPRVYAALTCDGQAQDGIGMLRRLEEVIRARAAEEWLRTKNPDADRNWTEAERGLLRLHSRSHFGDYGEDENKENIETSFTSQQDADTRWLHKVVADMADRDTVSKLDTLERKYAAQTQELESLRCRYDEMQHQLAGNHLQQELDATDRLLVERNQYVRQLELTLCNTRAELASRDQALAAATARLEQAERQCADKDTLLQEISRQFHEHTVALHDLPAPEIKDKYINVSGLQALYSPRSYVEKAPPDSKYQPRRQCSKDGWETQMLKTYHTLGTICTN